MIKERLRSSVDLTEMNKLEEYLKLKGIPYERFDQDEILDFETDRGGCTRWLITQTERHQICVPNRERCKWDAICHYGSYGYEKGLLEIYGSIVWPRGDSVEGYLTAADVIERIESSGAKMDKEGEL